MLMKKIHCQPRPSTSGPPISHAVVAPKPPSAPQIPSALLRSAPSGKSVVMIESAVGVMIAAPMPWKARAPISAGSDQASPQRSEASVKRSDADHEHAAPPEQVGRPPSEQEQAARR